MKLFGILSKKTEKDEDGNSRKRNDTRELEIYSGMRVLVENPDGTLLFIAKLKDPQSHMAELYQYSEVDFFQDMDTEAFLKTTPVPVKIRGYNENKRKAVFMEGNLIPKQKHVWQIDGLNVTTIENERSYPRLDTDIDAAIMISGENDTEERACKLFNISVGGAGIGSEDPYYKGDKFFLKAKLFDDKRTFVVYCEVMHVTQKDTSQFEYGCRFLELTEASQEEITRFIAQTGQAG